MRLDRLLSERGIESRKEARYLIGLGRVTVDGSPATGPEMQVSENAEVFVDDEPLLALPLMLAWHKPAGIVSTLQDPWGRRTLAEVLPEEWRTRFHPVGRLDAETTGLLLFSRDGALTQRLLHPKRAVPRTYKARVARETVPELAARLAAGVETAEGIFTAEVVEMKDDFVTLTVREGRHRMVRRMLHNAGFSVLELSRVAFGTVVLGDLPEGEARPVVGEALAGLQAI